MQVHDNACECQPGFHIFNNTCEADDVENCGTHGTSCSLTVNGWADGNCVQATCTVKTCAEGMHVYENACELDDVENCGLHGRACATTVAGWQSGACAQGTCKLLQCIDGFHVNTDTGECAQDTKACCGASCIKCAEGLVCAGGECRAQCKDTEAYCNGECTNIETSTENCGACGHDCNAEKPQNAKSMSCQNSICNIVDCDPDYHIEIQDDKRVCKADTANACGAQATNCTKNTWWEDGTCKAGKCIPSACKGDYHLAQDNSGENFCEADDAQNCGEHGHACAGGQQCAGGRCLGNTICDDVLRNTLTDLDHCGDCNHRCDDGLICDKGQCKKGNGQAYCSGNKVTMGTIDRCSSCSDKCSDSLICKDNACVTGAGMTYCSGNTINTLTDIDHCGSCNHKCGNGLICSEGTCKSGNGMMYCSGIKVDSTNDSAHCSGCGNLCPAGSKCGKTSNIVACNEGVGVTYCSGILRNTSDDSANCGQCGKKCAVGQICQSGTCATGTGYTICDGKGRNTSNDSAHCGQCGKKCAVGQICQSGSCATGTGATVCDGKNANTTQALNCGQCGNTCSSDKTCKASVCSTGIGVGDTIVFGNYNDTPIQWYILDNDTANHRIMLLSMDILGKRPYHTKSEAVTWAESTIRSWLNGYGSNENKQSADYTSSNFITTAFTNEERARIVKLTVVNENNPVDGTPGGANTQDQVFLLSIAEVKNLLGLTKKIYVQKF
ncbi:MAG: hypothetical protein IJ268_10305, partial [Proteobacteria bacterium]|nr:hypothetical protein [Pseudomonadota bacterium]